MPGPLSCRRRDDAGAPIGVWDNMVNLFVIGRTCVFQLNDVVTDGAITDMPAIDGREGHGEARLEGAGSPWILHRSLGRRRSGGA